MDDRLRELLETAKESVPARDANTAIARWRGQTDDSRGLRSYEIVLTTWQQLVESQLPKLVYHLESVGAHLPRAAGVIVAAFSGERLHLFAAADFVRRIGDRIALSSEEMVRRYGTGESRTAAGDPLLLPGPRN